MTENIISNIIYKLLTEHKKVSLTGLGYFELIHQSSFYDTVNKTIQPPINRVLFRNRPDEAIDNLLEKTLSNKLGIIQVEAFNKIMTWVEEICIPLSEKGAADLGNLGNFHVDEEGKIIFNLIDGTDKSKDSYGLDKIKIERIL